MAGLRLDIKAVDGLPEGISYDDLGWVIVNMPPMPDLSPRGLGYDYDTWDEYYEAHPDDKPEYCDCCGSRV